MDEYGTTDFYLACYLKASGMNLSRVERKGSRATFIFNDTKQREQMVMSYYGEGIVSVNDFVHAIDNLKSVVYNI